ncbi:MAG TPA: S26 family signal peptidase, partial [Edaphobacter sp.]|nr:S26 family signal peptidase [Edaphobacter sp.]
MSATALTSGPTPHKGDPPAGLPPGSAPPTPPRSSSPLHPPHAHKPGILPAIQSLITIIVVAVFIVTFTVQPFRIPSGSMEPTLL